MDDKCGGEYQKMKKGDKGKKVLDVIVVPLILNSISRRFKRESKRKLGENIFGISNLETKRIFNVLIFLVILNMLFMPLLTCTAHPDDQEVNIVNLIQCENETTVLHPKVEIEPTFSSNQIKELASSTIVNAVGMDYFVSRYQLVDVKYDDIDNTYITKYDYTADTGDTVEMRMIIDGENGNPLPPYWQKILLIPQKVMVSKNDAEKVAFEVGITSNITSRLDLLPQYPNFKKLVWIVSQAPSESTLPNDNRTAYIDAENSELIMVEKFGYYASSNFTNGINSSNESKLELPNNTEQLNTSIAPVSDYNIYLPYQIYHISYFCHSLVFIMKKSDKEEKV
jgi:hypothetical protein